MSLTDRECQFLAVFIHEATTDPFQGPATAELHRRDIYYTDIGHLLTAYYREHDAGQQGLGGKATADHLPCPWQDRDAAVCRDEEVKTGLVGTAGLAAS